MQRGDYNIETKLHMTPIYLSVYQGHFECVKILAENGADFNVVNQAGNTLLHSATLKDRLDIVEYLVKSLEVDLQARNNSGETAC